MIPGKDRVLVFTDHSVIKFTSDGTPCESIILDSPVNDAVVDKEGRVMVFQKEVGMKEMV